MSKSSLGKNTVLLMVGTILTKGIAFIMAPLFSRWLNMEDYGRFDLICTYVTLLIPFITLSSGDAMFRFSIDETEEQERCKYITNGFFIDTFNLIVAAAILGIIYMSNGWNLSLPFFVLLTSEILNKYFQGVLRAIKKLGIYSFCSVISSISILISVTFFILVLDMGLTGIIYGYALGYFIGVFIVAFKIKIHKYIDARLFSFKCIKKMIKYSLPLVPNSISWWIINVSDRQIINWALGSSANGIYAIAYKVPNLCSSLTSVFNISWQQTASEISNENDRNKYFNKIFNQLYIITISVCSCILSLNFIFFNWIFDAKFNDARLYTPILTLSILFSTLSLYWGGIQISMKKTKENGISTVVGALSNILFNVILIDYIGLYAPAVSTVISTLITALIRLIRLQKSYTFYFSNTSKLATLQLIYFFIASYLEFSFSYNLFNVVLAITCFIIFNREKIMKTILTLKKILKLA